MRRFLLPWRRAVLAGVPFCIAAVILVARPSFLFGGVGLRPKGIVVAALQVPLQLTSLLCSGSRPRLNLVLTESRQGCHAGKVYF